MFRRRLVWIVVPAIAAAGLALLLIPRQTTAGPSLVGTSMRGRPATDFHLTDQFGRRISLSQFRGEPVLVTFMEAHCKTLCPLVAEKLRRAVTGIGRAGRQVAILVVSVDPEGDTPAAVQKFSVTHGMLHRWHYLTASRAELTPTWRAYAIYAPPRGAAPALRDSHTSATYLIDQQGRERVLFASTLDVQGLEQDLRILLGLPVGGRSAIADAEPVVGYPAPDFALRDVSGKTLGLSSLQGKVVLLNFWATWCTVCKTEMPELERAYRRLRLQGFVVLGVDQQETRSAVAGFLRELHISYPNVLDENGSIDALYNVYGLPMSFVIDRQGIIQALHIGAIGPNYVASHVEPLLRKGA